MTTTPTKTGSWEDFKQFTLAVARGEQEVNPSDPKIWIEGPTDDQQTEVKFKSMEAGVKILSSKNRELLLLIYTRKPQSVHELAGLSGRAEQNVLRTLRKLTEAGIVRLERGAGRALRPVLQARKVHFEIDLFAQ